MYPDLVDLLLPILHLDEDFLRYNTFSMFLVFVDRLRQLTFALLRILLRILVCSIVFELGFVRQVLCELGRFWTLDCLARDKEVLVK